MMTRSTLKIGLLFAVCALGLGVWASCASVKRFMYEGFDRDAWQQPERVVTLLALDHGDRVADLGAGGGYFTLPLAHAVGETGRVYAVDIDADMVKYVLGRAREQGLTQVEGVVAGATDTGLAPDSVDLIFVSNTFHHLPDPPIYFERIRAALRPGGRIAIIEVANNSFPKGHNTPPEIIREQMRAAGYSLVQGHEFLERQSFQIFVPID